MLDGLRSDVRYALRSLGHAPGLVAVALLVLGAGVGLGTTFFTVVNDVVLRPLPVRDPEGLVQIYQGRKEFPYSVFSYPEYLDLRERARTVEGLAAYSRAVAVLAGDEAPEILQGELVSANYFDLLGVTPHDGRGFLPDEDRPAGARPVVVLSHGLWVRRFGADPSLVGRTVRLSGTPFEVVGIAPEGFYGMTPVLAADFWAPLAMDAKVNPVGVQEVVDVGGEAATGGRLERRGWRWLFLFGRTRPGVGPDSVQAEIAGIVRGFGDAFPDLYRESSVTVLPARSVRIHPMVDGPLRLAAAVLMGVVALVLLVACANLANLLLARAAARRRELAVRCALGASGARLGRQLLVESGLLAAGGGLLGLLVTFGGRRAVLALLPPLALPLRLELAVDGRVFLFAVAVAAATTLLFGAGPALAAARTDVAATLKDDAPGLAGGRRRRWTFRRVLSAGQIAVSLVLLVGATLLGRSLGVARSIDLGFEPHGLAVVSVHVGMQGYDEARGRALFRAWLDAVRARPEVAAAALATRVPLSPDINVEGILPDGAAATDEREGLPVDAARVGAGYFATMGIALRAGREFGPEDREGGAPVAIVNEAAEERYFDGDALGKRFRTDPNGPRYTIVGVVRDHKLRTVGEPERPAVFFCLEQRYAPRVVLLARAARADAAALVSTVEGELHRLDPALAVGTARTMEDYVETSLYPVRMGAWLLAALGALALLLAAVGLAGVVAYAVARRLRELGIRMALGATRRRILGHVLGEAVAVALVGVGVGLAGAAAATRLLGGILYGVGTLDPLSFAAAAAILVAVALVSSYWPARRAARLDPAAVLRRP